MTRENSKSRGSSEDYIFDSFEPTEFGGTFEFSIFGQKWPIGPKFKISKQPSDSMGQVDYENIVPRSPT